MPEPLFVLSPPRSFSSVIAGIIGQHPQCYALPELNLLLADTLGEVWSFSSPYMRSFGRDGLLRALAQLHDGTQTVDTVERAQRWVEQHSAWPVRKVFDHIQEIAGPAILVEKSPMFVSKRDYLDRLIRTFPRASLLHLIRHPRSMGMSVISMLQKQGRSRLIGNIPGRDPETVWRDGHESVLAVTEWLPVGQCMRLKGEAFLADLDTYLPQICEWLGVSREPAAVEAMKHPERSPYACPGPRNAARGNDPNFLNEPRLDADRLARMQEPSLAGELGWRAGETFAKETVKLARQFGYS